MGNQVQETTAIFPLTVSSHAVPRDPIWRLSVAQYHRMIQEGILTDDDHVELLQGWLVTTMPKSPTHRLVTQLTREAIANVLPDGWYVDAQEPITLMDSEPEPDVAVIRGDRRDYAHRHPGPEDVVLVVEVSDTTLQRDRTLKQTMYAAARIPMYWIININERQCEVYSNPAGSIDQAAYQQRQDYAETDTAPLVVDGQEIGQLAVRTVLG